MRDICAYLGGRADKDFLGTGNLGLGLQAAGVRVLFVQNWREGGLLDWAAGGVRAWAPDRAEMLTPAPPVGARLSRPPAARWVFVARDDVVGMTLEWENDTPGPLVIQAVFTGALPGAVRLGQAPEAGRLYAQTSYSDRVPQPVHLAVAAALAPDRVALEGAGHEIAFTLALAPGARGQVTLLLGMGFDRSAVDASLQRWQAAPDVLAAVRQDWNAWFDQAIPRFRSSNPYFEKLYYYRWWSLYTKMITARVGHLLHPAPREGAVAFEGCVSYSSACVSVDELRWLRDPAWALGTTREFFAPENLNDGYLANHIWDWGIDGDESNQDTLGRSVPYHSYAVAAFYGTVLVHPAEGAATLPALWPQLVSHLAAYPRVFDIDQDGLYETYPWSNAAGQEWAARYLYFDPIGEVFRYERGRTYAPDGSRVAEDLALVQKIRRSVVTDPELRWPETAEALYRLYFGTRDHRLATVDQSTYAYQDFRAAAGLAGLLPDAAAERRYTHLAEQTRAQILAAMWDPHTAFFYDLQPVTHKPARVKAVTGFYVFWAQLAEPAHLPMLDHLFNPAAFWTQYPLPSLPLDYTKYAELQAAGWTYWNYCTWPRTTCHVVDGLLWAAKALDPALAGPAAQLFERYTRMHFRAGDVQRPTLAERYDPHTAEPEFEHLDYNHSAWIDLLIRRAAGLTPQPGDEIVIDPVDMGWEAFALDHIRYRNHDVDIEFSAAHGLVVRVDGVVKAQAPRLQKLVVTP